MDKIANVDHLSNLFGFGLIHILEQIFVLFSTQTIKVCRKVSPGNLISLHPNVFNVCTTLMIKETFDFVNTIMTAAQTDLILKIKL